MVIEERFEGNVAEFGRACQEYDNSVNRSNVASVLDRESLPRLDTAAIFAQAAGVTLDWLAGIEKAPRSGIEGLGPIVGEAKGNYGLVEPESSPSETVWPGFAIGLEGEEQLTIDFVVKGRTARGLIPLERRDREEA